MPVPLIEATKAFRKKKGEKGKIDRASWQARLIRRRYHHMRVHEARPDGSLRLSSPCCPNKPGITIPVTAGAKFHQELEFGMEEHQKRYALMRNTNEGFNGTSKDGGHAGLGQATRRRKRGIAAQSLQCAFLLFAENVRRIESFQKKAVPDSKGNLILKRKGRPPRKGLRDFLPSDGTVTLPRRPTWTRTLRTVTHQTTSRGGSARIRPTEGGSAARLKTAWNAFEATPDPHPHAGR